MRRRKNLLRRGRVFRDEAKSNATQGASTTVESVLCDAGAYYATLAGTTRRRGVQCDAEGLYATQIGQTSALRELQGPATTARPISPKASSPNALRALCGSFTSMPIRKATAPATTMAADQGYPHARKGRAVPGSRRRRTI